MRAHILPGNMDKCAMRCNEVTVMLLSDVRIQLLTMLVLGESHSLHYKYDEEEED